MKELNETTSLDIQKITHFKFLKSEEEKILKKFKVENGDIVNLYNNYIFKLKNKEKKIFEELKFLQNKIDLLIGKKGNKIYFTTFGSKESLFSSFTIIQNEFNLLKEFFNNFINKIYLEIQNSKKITNKIINLNILKAQNLLKPLINNNRILENKIQNINFNKENKFNNFKNNSKIININQISITYDFHSLFEQSSNIFQSINIIKERSLKFGNELNEIFNKISEIEIKFENLNNKINKLNLIKKKNRTIRSFNNFRNLALNLLKFNRQENALKEALNDIELKINEEEPLLIQEKEFLSQKVEDSGMTILKLRQEISRLLSDITRENLEKSEELRQLKNKEIEFNKKSINIIETLETNKNNKFPIPLPQK